MIWFLLTIWLVGAAASAVLTFTHRGTWPYTEGGYRQQRGRMLWNFWKWRTALIVLWPVFVVIGGLMATWEELT